MVNAEPPTVAHSNTIIAAFVSVNEFSTSIPKQQGADQGVLAFVARNGVLET
jgi:hypothetical protein